MSVGQLQICIIHQLWLCGTGIEECDTLRGQKKRDCEKDPRKTWRSYLVNINFDGDIIWEKTGSFVFPGEEDSEDLASVAAEWVFINSKVKLLLLMTWSLELV